MARALRGWVGDDDLYGEDVGEFSVSGVKSKSCCETSRRREGTDNDVAILDLAAVCLCKFCTEYFPMGLHTSHLPPPERVPASRLVNKRQLSKPAMNRLCRAVLYAPVQEIEIRFVKRQHS